MNFILGIPLTPITQKDAAKRFVEYCNETKQIFTATPNAEIILEALKNPDLFKYLNQCDLNCMDSVSLYWAAATQHNQWSVFRALLELIALPFRKRFWKNNFPETVSGADVFFDICKAAEQAGKSIFLLGGQDGVARVAKTKLQRQYPKLKLCGGIDGSPLPENDKAVVKNVNDTNPDIVFVAYGCPKQECWIARNLKKCPSVKVAMGIGGTFDFVAGKITRAPKWMQKCGLEWLYRLIQEPRRIGRIWRATVVFPFVFLKAYHKNSTYINNNTHT